ARAPRPATSGRDTCRNACLRTRQINHLVGLLAFANAPGAARLPPKRRFDAGTFYARNRRAGGHVSWVQLLLRLLPLGTRTELSRYSHFREVFGDAVHRHPLTAWTLLKEGVIAFIDDSALTRGAAIAFYAVTAIAPVLFIMTAIAALFLGQDAASGAVHHQLTRIMTSESADLVQLAILHLRNG